MARFPGALLTLVVPLLLSTAIAHALPINPSSEEEYCAVASDLKNFKAILANTETLARLQSSHYEVDIGNRLDLRPGYLPDPAWSRLVHGGPYTRMAFLNDGRIFGINTGVCWWHSRFQRSITYLGIFRELRPGEAPMSKSEINRAIGDIIKNRRVVEFRGFAGPWEFTALHADRINSRLEHWAEKETVAFGWVKGAFTPRHMNPARLKRMMDETYRIVSEQNHIAFQIFQLPGIEAHAGLVFEAKKWIEKGRHVGYIFSAVESNSPSRSFTYDYRFGWDHLGGWVPYNWYEEDFEKIERAIQARCGSRSSK